ncbi:MAG: D-Ala-D-Ala carboxypeptidase family metallohydrolase [Caldilineaceae bacterium]
MTPNFTLSEFERSQAAARRGLLNRVPVELMANATATLMMLQRIRDFLSARAGRPVPITISSGYRSLAVNKAVGGAKTSDHTRAAAVDWSADSFGTPFEICSALQQRVDELGIGQLINEFPPHGWVHTSIERPQRPVNRVITISAAGTVPGIVLA